MIPASSPWRDRLHLLDEPSEAGGSSETQLRMQHPTVAAELRAAPLTECARRSAPGLAPPARFPERVNLGRPTAATTASAKRPSAVDRIAGASSATNRF